MTAGRTAQVSPIFSSCVFPVEVLDEIFVWCLADKHEFPEIANLSLASYQFRQIVLRQYFVTLYAHSRESWSNICQIPGVFSWVRVLNCISVSLFSGLSNLLCFHNLREVHIDFSPEGLHTQQTCARKIFKYLPAKLTALELSYLPKIDVDLLSRIALKFPMLKALKLSCSERLINDCCWECYEESSSCTIHSPIPDIYIDADDMAYAFGSALKPLKHLEHLHLGIYLSELELFYYHILHCQMVILPSMNRVWPHAPNDCEHCCQNFADEVRTTELFASAALARYVPSVKTICWSSFFAADEPGDYPDEQTTMVWVMRKDGKVKVRRAVW
ncbi:unnamed protein product [Somion occarium]|uniref:F-box domain-containing protein n=1 Tax=Somion occarium TaxID=3059160 RepID=A0ABP1E757_9APHY